MLARIYNSRNYIEAIAGRGCFDLCFDIYNSRNYIEAIAASNLLQCCLHLQ